MTINPGRPLFPLEPARKIPESNHGIDGISPHMIQDFKFAVRQLLKAPGFTIAAVIVLALGIGANTAVFSLVHTMFFAPPGYARPHEVVQVFS